MSADTKGLQRWLLAVLRRLHWFERRQSARGRCHLQEEFATTFCGRRACGGGSHGEGCLVDGLRVTLLTSLTTSIHSNERGFNPLAIFKGHSWRSLVGVAAEEHNGRSARVCLLARESCFLEEFDR